MELIVFKPSILSEIFTSHRDVYIGGRVNRTFLFHQGGRGTGGVLWPAAELLCLFLARSDNVFARGSIPEELLQFDGKYIVELGAGLGILSLTLACLGAFVVSTDGEESVTKQLDNNINRGLGTLSENCVPLVYGWGDSVNAIREALERFPMSTGRPDIIVAADVVYGNDPISWVKLEKSIRMLSEDSDANHPTLLYIAHTHRYQEEQLFFRRLQRNFELVACIDISGKPQHCPSVNDIQESMATLYIYARK